MNTSSSLATLTSSDAVLSAYAPDPNPAEAFTAWLAIEFGDPAVRPTLEISIELDAALVAAFDGVQIGAPFENRLDATSSLVGNVLTVSVSDDGGSPFLGYEVRHDGFLALHFNGVSAGQHEIDLQSVDAEDSQGVPLSLNWQLSDVVVDVATAQITTSEFDVAHSSENYVGILEASHFPVGPVTWTLDSGQLPAGLTLSESGVVFGVVDAGTSGSFGFTARATGADGTAATRALQIDASNRAPVLASAEFEDVDSSGTVTTGDTITLAFQEPVTVGANALSALTPSKAGDSFGVAAISAGPKPDEVVLSLGAGATLAGLGGDSGVVVSFAADGILDEDATAAGPATVLFTEDFETTGRFIWVKDVPIAPIVLSAAPFPNPGYTVTGLPAGLTFSNSTISGTPTEVTPIDDDDSIVVRDANDDPIAVFSRNVLEEALPSFGLADPEFDEQHPGAALYLQLITSDESTPVTATIGGTPLILLPGSTATNPIFVLPDNATTGTLVISQGVNSFDAGVVQVVPLTNPSDPTPLGQTIWSWYADEDGYVNGVVHASGKGFTGQTFQIDGITVTPVVAGDTYCVLPIPASVTGEGTMDICIGATCLSTVSNCRRPRNVPRKAGMKAYKKALCLIIDEAHKMLEQGEKSAKRAKTLLLGIALVESGLCTPRIQGDYNGNGKRDADAGEPALGPAYGIFQMEPGSFKDMWQNTSAKCKQAMAKAAGLTDQNGNGDAAALGAEVDKIKGNDWKLSAVCGFLRTLDLFAVLAARCELKRDPDELDPELENPPPPPPDIPDLPENPSQAQQQAHDAAKAENEKFDKWVCKVVDEWWRTWKKKAGRNQTEQGQKDKAKKAMRPGFLVN